MILKFEITEKGLEHFIKNEGTDETPLYWFFQQETGYFYALIRDNRINVFKLVQDTEYKLNEIMEVVNKGFVKEVDRFCDPIKMFDDIE